MIEYVIRCQPDNLEVASYIVRDASGEVLYYPNIDDAIAWVMDYQESSEHATYTVETEANRG